MATQRTVLPRIGLGTFRLKDQDVIDSVTSALSLGYRHIDTAQFYGNERGRRGAPCRGDEPLQHLEVARRRRKVKGRPALAVHSQDIRPVPHEQQR